MVTLSNRRCVVEPTLSAGHGGGTTCRVPWVPPYVPEATPTAWLWAHLLLLLLLLLLSLGPSPQPKNTGMCATQLLALLLLTTAAAYDNGASIGGVSLALPPRGWTTWCTDDVCGLLDFCNEAEVKSIADAMVAQGMRRLNYSLILLECVPAAPRSPLAAPPWTARGARFARRRRRLFVHPRQPPPASLHHPIAPSVTAGPPPTAPPRASCSPTPRASPAASPRSCPTCSRAAWGWGCTPARARKRASTAARARLGTTAATRTRSSAGGGFGRARAAKPPKQRAPF
jgi:hypothetical protein